MRILNIYFKNINSLEGESRIDFEQSPFSDTGVFAITGPNGSGKSSILDAITLGLYGETFRFDRPARHVMTKHMAESFSVIEFALGKDKYRSSWQVQREQGSPEGELMLPAMSLLRLSDGEELLADTPQQVCARITDLTGMNFRNFTRSIMLAQGDFAAFLNALDSERMDILEKIISTDIYADYKNEITENNAKAQQQLEQLKQDLAVLPVMTDEAVEACEHDLTDFKDQYAEFQEQHKSLKQQQSALQNSIVIQGRIDEEEIAILAVKNQAENTRAQLAQIESLQDAIAFKEEIDQIKAKHHEIHLSKNALSAFHKELNQLEQALEGLDADKTASEGLAGKSVSEQKQTLDNIRDQLSLLSAERRAETGLAQSLTQQIGEKQSALATVEAWLAEHAADETLLTNFPETGRLKKLRADLLDLSEKHKSFAKWSKTTQATLKNNKSAIEQEHKKIAGLKQQLQAEEKALDTVAEGRNLEAIEDLRQDQQERVNSFQELNNLALAQQKLANGKAGFFHSLLGRDKHEADADELSLELEQLKQQISREENIKNTLETAVFNENLLKKMEPDRRHLVHGKPCPLCGALQHPYVRRAPVPTNSQQALIDQRAKIQALTLNVSQLSQQISVAQKTAENKHERQLKRQQISARWLTLCNRLNTASDELDINNLKLMQRLLKVETAELQDIAALANRYRSTQAGIEKLKNAIAKSEADLVLLKERTQKLDAEWQGRPQEQFDIEAALPNLQKEEKELAEKVQKELAALGEKMPAKGKEDALFDRLNSRRQDYHSYAFRRKNLTEELHALVEKEANCRANIKVCDDRLAHFNGQLRTEETVGLHLALIEKQKLIADKEQLLAQQEAESASLERALLEKMQGTQFTSVKQLSDSLALMDHQPELERQLAELEQEIDARTVTLAQSQADLETEQASIVSAISAQEIDAELKSINEKADIARLEVQRLDQLLQQQKQVQQRYDAIQSRLQEQEKIAEQYRAEVEEMAAEHGMAFRRRVQEKIAGQLLSKTNEVLEKISGRYYLRQSASEQGLALEIEDTYQGNVRRLPKTLSGGESFVVSLALALGLSELANNGKSVDSLFLDEGFGNLDAETLYTVISTLEGLHTHGKTVGVISHVEGVHKRFKAQLQVVKKPNGMGELRKAS